MRMVEHKHPRRCLSCEALELRLILRRHNRLLNDNQVAFSNVNNRVSNQEEAQNSRQAKLLEIVTQQKRRIYKFEPDCGMLYQLILGFAKSTQSKASDPRIYIGPVSDMARGEETIQQNQEMEMEPMDQDLNQTT